MKRTRIDLNEVAAYGNLAAAARLAAQGKRNRPDVRAFFADLDGNLARLGEAILTGRAPLGGFRTFRIRDPKPRTIHAAEFVDRVYHHALMNLAGPVLERAMTPHTYACLTGRGNHAAALRAWAEMRRGGSGFQPRLAEPGGCTEIAAASRSHGVLLPSSGMAAQPRWFVQIDIDGYFAAIDHRRLMELLERRFKGDDFLAALWRVIAGYESAPGKGLPIGSLTSQHFANYYLDGFDRRLAADGRVPAQVRYMDDILWWTRSRLEARETLAEAIEWLSAERFLKVKAGVIVNRVSHGTTFCGFRIIPAGLRLSRRRQRLYTRRRLAWEAAYRNGEIDAGKVQRAYNAVHAITLPANSRAWRRESLRRFPPVDV